MGKDPYDAFDPSLLPAMSQEGHFGHHIFGQKKWKDLTGQVAPSTEDLLSLYFRREIGFKSYFSTEGVFHGTHDSNFPNFTDHGLGETHLDLTAYSSIYPDGPRNGRFISTHLYKFGKKGKAIWIPLICPQDVWKRRYMCCNCWLMLYV